MNRKDFWDSFEILWLAHSVGAGGRRRMLRRGRHLVSRLDSGDQHVPGTVELFVPFPGTSLAGLAKPAVPPAADGYRQGGGLGSRESQACLAASETSSCPYGPPGRRYHPSPAPSCHRRRGSGRRPTVGPWRLDRQILAPASPAHWQASGPVCAGGARPRPGRCIPAQRRWSPRAARRRARPDVVHR